LARAPDATPTGKTWEDVKERVFSTPSIFAVNENEATLSACICNRVQPVHRHMNRMWCRQSAHREIKLHAARLSVEHLNAVIEKFPGTVITEIVKIWAENALGAGSQESCEFILPNSQVERRTQTFAPSLYFQCRNLAGFSAPQVQLPAFQRSRCCWFWSLPEIPCCQTDARAVGSGTGFATFEKKFCVGTEN